MAYQEIISAIGLVGLGGMLQSGINYLLNKKELKSQAQHEFKNTRYKALILLANAMLDFDKHQKELKKHGRDFTAKAQLLDELIIERDNMILFASDKVILSLSAYIRNPTREGYYELAISMRKDLYGLKTRLTFSEIVGV
ncbi:hypothetical protein [Chitinophaga sp. CB10]|uniref:hypothetical protein n=1 Tax=Chitinophaga sp. CB10 TaxID=1891659 RepID=UPI0025C4CFB7|nr:hypothetical protein [Chitinophaga sp. CB10]